MISSQLTGDDGQSKTADAPVAAETAPGGLFEVKRRASLMAHKKASSSTSSYSVLTPTTVTIPQPQLPPPSPAMQAIKLQRKYPQVSQEEMFALIEKFK